MSAMGYVATQSMAILTALLCAGLPAAGLAQAKPAATPGMADARKSTAPLDAAAGTGAAQAGGQRVALVIGNAAYQDAPLSNPVNDARSIAQVLREAGFAVIARENIDQRTMLAVLREFGDRLRAGGTGLFYYAGHGMQIKGRNYLIPVGAKIEREDEVAYSAVDAQAVLDKMEVAGNLANIMILDACRNNPFTRNTRSGQAGLAQMDAPVGTLIAYATSPGAVASDGAGTNGLYTQHLLSAIRQPGSKVEDVFKQVRANVRRDSQGKQVPWEATSLEGDFYFIGTPRLASADAAAAQESALWDAVKGSDLPVEIRVYLNRYPNGKFAAPARARLAQLQLAPAVAKAPAPVPVPAPAPASTPPLTLPSPPLAPASAAPANAARSAVGDQWTFERHDLVANKKSKYVHRVTAVAANGDATINGGEIVLGARGQFKFLRSPERERSYGGDGLKTAPSVLQAGAREAFDYEVVSKYKDGRSTRFVSKGSLEVIGLEKVATPAGDFAAWRFVRDGRGAVAGGDDIAIRGSYWYVPALKRSIAWDIEERNLKTGQLIGRERAALVAVSLANSAALASVKANREQAARLSGGASFKGQPAAALDSEQADIDRRTQEILARLASASAPVVKTAAPTSNRAGFTAGDRWRYQKVDKFKHEVVSNWSLKVDSFNPDGSIKLNGGSTFWTAEGAIKSLHGSNGYLRDFSPPYKWLPGTLGAGYSEAVKHSMVWRNTDGRNGTEERQATVKVLAQETIKVPAGEFDAWKIELTGFGNGQDLSAARPYVVKIKETWWYVPALRNYVAREYEQRDARNQLEFFERHELTSFAVRGAGNLGQR